MKKTTKRTSSHFKHLFLRHWREQIATPKVILVAVSGGVDSVVLLDLLLTWQPLLGYELAVGHVHHGKERGPQGTYRERARALTRQLAETNRLPYFTNATGRGIL